MQPFPNKQEADMHPRNLAARAGRWSARHRRAAILGWIAFVIASIALGGALGTKQIEEDHGVGEAARAHRTIERELPDRVTEQVLVQSRTSTLDEPRFRAALADVERRQIGRAHV